MEQNLYTEDLKVIFKQLNTDSSSGLSRHAARMRLAKERKREGGRTGSLFVRDKRSALSCFLRIFSFPCAILLMAIGILAFALGHTVTGATIFIIFFAACIPWGISYFASQRSIETVANFSNPTSRVLRQGEVYVTDCRNVVEGDVIVVTAGDFISCDARLIDSDSLAVNEYIKTDGGVSQIYSKKQVGLSAKNTLFGENDILLAGSFVVKGSGRAIVIASGENTYASEFLRNGSLAQKDTDNDDIKTAGRVVARYNILSAIIILALAVIGIFTSHTADVADVFLLALSIYFMLTLLNPFTIGRMISAATVERAASPKTPADFAIIKKNSAMASLSSIDELVLLGRAGVTDGQKHMASVFSEGKRYDGEDISSDSHRRLCGHVYTYISALDKDSMPRTPFADNGLIEPLRKFILDSHFDVREAELKIKSIYYIPCAETKTGFACAETEDFFYRTALTDNEDIISQCDGVRWSDGVLATSEVSGLLREYIEAEKDLGRELLFSVSDIKGKKVLEGIFSFEEGMATEMEEYLPIFEKLGMNVTVLFCEGGKANERYLAGTGILGERGREAVAYKEEFDALGRNVTYRLGEYRAYVGFSPEEYTALVKEMRSRGKVVAAYGVERRFDTVMFASDLSIGCDMIKYSSKKFREAVLDNIEADGEEYSRRSSQFSRAYCSVIVKRTSEEGGGLRGILRARDMANNFSENFSHALLFLSVFALSCILPAVVSLISGYTVISYPCLLLLVTAGGVSAASLFATIKPPLPTLRVKKRNSSQRLGKLFYDNIWRMVSVFVSTALYMALAAIMFSTGFISEYGGLVTATFLSLAAVSTIELVFSARACAGKNVIGNIKITKKEAIKKAIRHSIDRGTAYKVSVLLAAFVVVRLSVYALFSDELSREFAVAGTELRSLVLVAAYVGIYYAVKFISYGISYLVRKRRNGKRTHTAD